MVYQIKKWDIKLKMGHQIKKMGYQIKNGISNLKWDIKFKMGYQIKKWDIKF